MKQLDAELAAAEEGVTPLASKPSGDDWSNSDENDRLQVDGHLTRGEEVILKLREKSVDTPYAFIGLQLIDIGQTHVGPARDHLGKVTADAENRANDLQRSQHHIRRAGEMLKQLNRRYELVKMNEKLDEEIVHLKKMHQVFVEGTFALLQSKKPTLNPKSRKFLELDIDEEFLKNLKELLEKKRDIQAELAKILAEDPRLLRRYMAKTQLQADTLRDQLTLLAQQQREFSDEIAALEKAEEKERPALAAEQLKTRQIKAALQIVEESAKLLDNYVTWMPLDLDPAQGELAKMQESATMIATTARGLASAMADDQPQAALEQAKTLHRQLTDFEKRLPNIMNDHPNHDRLAVHVANRLAETTKLITRTSGWVYQADKAAAGQFHLAAEVMQHRIAVETATLGGKLENLNSWMSGMTFEIQEASQKLFTTMGEELIPDLVSAQMALRENQFKRTVAFQVHGVEGFAKAEKEMDELMDLIIKELDSRDVDTKRDGDTPLDTESLEDLLAMLEDEAQAIETLGIPNRPSNLTIEKDWLQPGNDGGGGAGQKANAAMAQAEAAQKKLEQMQQKLRKANRAVKKEGASDKRNRNARRDQIRWNTLASQLEDKLRQGRGHTPPEQYRRAIERYFEVITKEEDSGGR